MLVVVVLQDILPLVALQMSASFILDQKMLRQILQIMVGDILVVPLDNQDKELVEVVVPVEMDGMEQIHKFVLGHHKVKGILRDVVVLVCNYLQHLEIQITVLVLADQLMYRTITLVLVV